MGRAEQTARDPWIALVIEDQPEVRDLAAAILEETDLDVAEAGDAEEALRFLRQNARNVAMIFADVKLPGAAPHHPPAARSPRAGRRGPARAPRRPRPADGTQAKPGSMRPTNG